MKKTNLAFIVIITLFFAAGQTLAATYYLDSVNGNDDNSGTSPQSAWQSLEKINSTTFTAGDKILLKAGASWKGFLWPKGSGEKDNPIIIDRYGKGDKPLIDGAGLTGKGVVYLFNQSFWEINNLELTNDAETEGDRRGVYLQAENAGIIQHIYLKNLYIHNIKGIIGQGIKAKHTGGIGIRQTGSDLKDTRFDDILIQGCHIQTIDNTGIYTHCSGDEDSITPGTEAWHKKKITNLKIKNNTIHDIAKNAMIIRMADDTGVVEYNVCYDTAYRTGTGNTIFSRSCDGTVFQFNEGFLNRTTKYDGCLYDADLKSPRTVWQYSYSHDNNHGLIWFCTVEEDADIIVRYNISQNDKGRLVSFRYHFTSAYIYNNTFYIPPHLSPEIIHEKPGRNQTYYFYNNIVYNNSPTAYYGFADANRTFSHNTFYGIHPPNEPADPYKLTSDPRLVDPGSGGFGIDTLDGYKLQSDSPCIDSGMAIPNNGGRDYWANPLYKGKPDRGAHEYPGAKTGPLAKQAASPNPANGMPNITTESVLSWFSDPNTPSHDVYFGTNPRPGNGEFKANQKKTTFDPGTLTPGTTYYWRIDEKNNNGTAVGPVWNFTTEK